MQLYERIRNYFYKKSIAKKLQESSYKRGIINLNDAKAIGIVYDSTNPDNDIIITKFAENLRKQGKTVSLLGFVNDKKIDHKSDILVFNKKCLSWTKIPHDERVDKFSGQNFDLLLGCFIGENLPLEYVTSVSHAKWRVGAYSENKTDCYDMMIDLGGSNDLQYMLDQTVHFLNEIKYDS